MEKACIAIIVALATDNADVHQYTVKNSKGWKAEAIQHYNN
jgi:hypothetical protein